jgi:D-alanyl-D-alanine carboxypeptidase
LKLTDYIKRQVLFDRYLPFLKRCKMKRSAFIAILIFCLVHLKLNGQNDSLIKIMESHLVKKGKKPVCSIQIYISKKDNNFCDAVGVSDGKNEKADKDNQFKIASITKTMTAAIILQLQEEGLLDINEKISKYLGDIEFLKINDLHIYNGQRYGREITLKQLLQHKSGIADIFTDASFRFYLNEYFDKKQEWNAENLIMRYYRYNLNKKAHFVPGEGYFYSDVNYFLLGIMIENITGKSLAMNFRKRIFEPLGMDNSYFEYYESPKGNGKLANSFMGKRNISRILNTSYDWAGGGVISTTTDLARFLEGLFCGKLFKNDSTIHAMTGMVPHTLKSGRIGYYGLGLSQYIFNDDVYYGHSGFWGSLIAYCPERKITFCGSVNQVNAPFNTNELIEKLIKTFNLD